MSSETYIQQLLSLPSISHALLSPDGRWVAYMSNESGREEVYVTSFPRGKGKWQVSTEGGCNPAWRADGGELYYLSTSGEIVAVAITSLLKAPGFMVCFCLSTTDARAP